MIKLLCIFLISDRFSRPKEIHFSLFTTRSSWRCTESYQRKYPNDLSIDDVFSEVPRFVIPKPRRSYAVSLHHSIVHRRMDKLHGVLDHVGFWILSLPVSS